MSKPEKEPEKLLASWRDENQTVEGPLIHDARKLSGLLVNYDDLMQSAQLANAMVLVSPQVEFMYQGEIASAYFFKDLKDKESVLAPISCFIGLRAEKDQGLRAYRFNLDPTSGQATSVEDYVPFNNVNLLSQAVRELEDNLARQQQMRNESRRHQRVIAIRALAVLAVLAGAAEGAHVLVGHIRVQNRKAEAARAAFDRSGYTLPGNVANLSTIQIEDVEPAQFGKIPMYHNRESLLSPRRFNLNENTCKEFQTKVQDGQDIVVAVSKADVMQNNQIIAGRDERGNLVICSTGGYPDSHTNWKLAVQLQK